MNTNNCAPNKYDKQHNTCLSLEQLIEICKTFNKHLFKYKFNPDKLSNISDNINLINIKEDKIYLLNELKSRFKKICNDEICLLNQQFMNEMDTEVRNILISSTFLPLGPEKSTDWLSTNDIDNVLQQYENIYSDFIFLGAVPFDCDELSYCSLFKINFYNFYREGIKRLAIVFNLDTHDKSGSHWVSLFIDLEKCEIYYCDSVGKPPKGNILNIIKTFNTFCEKYFNKNSTYKYNDIPYQKDKSECGVYSCNFIIRKLAGESFDSIIRNSLNFSEINSCRNAYFRNPTSQFKIHDKCRPK